MIELRYQVPFYLILIDDWVRIYVKLALNKKIK